jgi:hypothetical protein
VQPVPALDAGIATLHLQYMHLALIFYSSLRWLTTNYFQIIKKNLGEKRFSLYIKTLFNFFNLSRNPFTS